MNTVPTFTVPYRRRDISQSPQAQTVAESGKQMSFHSNGNTKKSSSIISGIDGAEKQHGNHCKHTIVK